MISKNSLEETFVKVAASRTLSLILWLIGNRYLDALKQLLETDSVTTNFSEAVVQLETLGLVEASEGTNPSVSRLGNTILRQMGMSPVLTSDITSALMSGQLTILIGSGLSQSHSTMRISADDFSEMITHLLAGPADPVIQKVLRFARRIPPEAILDLMSEHLPVRDIALSMKALLTPARSSFLEKFLVWSAAKFDLKVLDLGYGTSFGSSESSLSTQPRGITTETKGDRFDGIIQKGVTVQLQRMGLRASKQNSLLDGILAMRQPEVTEQLQRILEKRFILLIAMSAMDDAIILLLRTVLARRPTEVLWLDDGNIDDADSDYIHEWLLDVGGGYAKANPEVFLHDLYTQIISGGDHDSLAKWDNPSNEFDTQKVEAKQKFDELLSRFGQILDSNNYGRVMVWAKLLERLHEVGAATLAFEQAIIHAPNEYQRIQIRLRLAILSRTSGDLRGSLDRLFEIEATLPRMKGLSDNQETSRLNASISHQLGVTYQMLRDHEMAEAKLKRAEITRKMTSDVELPYTQFQRLLNAVRFHEHTGKPVDKLAPPRWRSWMFKYLMSATERFRVNSRWSHEASMLHNASFTLAARAVEMQTSGDNLLAKKMFKQGQDLALQAVCVRRLLFEKRLTGQSEVLAAKCAHAYMSLCSQNESIDDLAKLYDSARRAAYEIYGSIKVPYYQKRDAQQPEGLLAP